MQLSQKQKNFFLIFFFLSGILNSILNIFQKKITLRADAFLNLNTPKNVIR